MLLILLVSPIGFAYVETCDTAPSACLSLGLKTKSIEKKDDLDDLNMEGIGTIIPYNNDYL